MLTHDQLTTIKANRDKLKAYSVSSSIVLNMQADIDTMLDEITRLHAALTTKDSDIAGFEIRIQSYKDIIAAKDSVLSQFTDTANWEYDPPLADESFPLWAWAGDDNPLHLATQALGEGK